MNEISDEKLFSLCKMFGSRALEARRKFLGLLPEVNKRRLYAKKGFSSIDHFANVLAGASKKQVRNVLNLNHQFAEKPILQKLLISGEVSVNKLIRVASIATSENQEELAEKVKLLSNRAIEVLVRDVKNEQRELHESDNMATIFTNNNGSQKPLFTHQELHVRPENHLAGQSEVRVAAQAMLQPPKQPAKQPAAQNIPNISRDINLMKLLSEEVKSELAELAEKEIDINKIIIEALQKRLAEIADKKEMISREIVKGIEFAAAASGTAAAVPAHTFSAAQATVATTPPASRYISVKIRRILSEEFGTKCSIRGCYRNLKVIHHTQRFALSGTHDPHFLAPLCKEHHAIAHSVDEKFWQKRRA